MNGRRRYALIKRVFEARRDRLAALRADPVWPRPAENRHAYSSAVVAYVRARNRWRRIRGWA